MFLLPPGSEAHDHLRLNPCVEGGDAGTPGIRSRGLSPLPRPLSCGFQFSRFKGRLMALEDIKAKKFVKIPDRIPWASQGCGAASCDVFLRHPAMCFYGEG